MIDIPSCYDPERQEARRQQQWDNAMAALQKCICCSHPLLLVRYTDLTAFGIPGGLCEECFFRHSQWPTAPDEFPG